MSNLVFTHCSPAWNHDLPAAIELERTRSGKTGIYYAAARGEDLLSVALMLGQTQQQVRTDGKASV